MPRTGVRVAAALFMGAFFGAGLSGAGELPGALLTLEAADALRADRVAAAAPFRFALFEDGQVYVGGTSQLLSGRLSKEEVSVLERRLGEVRKLPGLAGVVSFSAEKTGYRLGARKGKPLDVLAQGDPRAAHPALAPLATLVSDLAAFKHPTLRPFAPTSYALSAREGKLSGGCRPWTFHLPIADALQAPRGLNADVASGWPTGAVPAQVCAGDKTYLVTLRPLVAGEKP